MLHLILLSLLLVGAASAAPFTGEAQHVIIVMKEQAPASAGPAELAAFADQSQGDVIATLEKMGAADVTPLWSVNAVAATLSPEEVKKIAARSDVAMVVPDRVVTIDAAASSEKGERGLNFYKPAGEVIDYINPPSTSSEHIAWGVDWIEAPEVWENGFNGTGVTVAVVDTGIYADHPDLADKVVAWDDLVNGLPHPYDDHGHGTHCAGTIAGTGASGTKTGVAPGADLIGIKVFDSDGTANTSTVIRGFERAVELGADVISYSGGSIEFSDDVGDYLAINTSGIEIEIPVVNANDGFDPGFMFLEVEAPLYSGLEVTMKKPDGTVYPGVDCDWWDTPVPTYVGMVKYIGDAPLVPGNWTLRIENPSLNASDHVWWSGSDNYLYNTLRREFDLTEVDSATLQITSWYDIEDGYDYGYVEVYNSETGSWDTLLTLTGTGQGVSTIDLTPYCGEVIDLCLLYETDGSVAWYGWYVDEMAIPEIGYYDDAEDDGEWIPYGWSRITEEYPVYFSVTTCYADNGTSLSSQAVNRIVEDGTVFVTSAGNEGEYGLRTIGAPAAAEKAIAVGAIGESEDYIAAYSSRGPVGWGANQRVKPDLVAPGTYIESTYRNGGYETMSGTSMACPHVAGVVALMLDVNSSLTPAEIRSVLQRTAIDLGPTGPDTDYGAGRVSAWAAVGNITALQPPVYDQPGLYAGCAYTSYLKPGVVNNITAIAWDDGPVAGEEIWFRVTNSTATVLNITVMTDENGLAIASFVPVGGGYARYSFTVSDTHGNFVSDNIYTYEGYRSQFEAFDTPYKDYRMPINGTATIRYTLVDPATMAPYTGDVVMMIGSFYNRTFTPVNGTISADVTRELLGGDQYWGSVYLYPADNISTYTEVDAGFIYLIDYTDTVTEAAPYFVQAEPGGNATFVVKMYESPGDAPVADGTHSFSVIWIREADVKSLYAQFPEETARLRGGEAGGFSPEFMEEISNLQESMEQVSFTTTNGIGKLSIPVPEDARVGVVVQESEYYNMRLGVILVNMDPFMYHSTLPAEAHERWLSLEGSWNGTYNATTKRFDPGDVIDVRCYLEDAETGAPMAGTVYLYTSDGCTRVTTGTDGYGSATIPVVARFPGDYGYYNQVQVVGLSGDAYASLSLSPGGPIVLLSGEYVGGNLEASSAVTNAAGATVPMPGIFEVDRQVSGGEQHQQFYSSATTLTSQYTTGGGSYAGAVDYGSYTITHYMKELVSQGSWTSWSISTAATPLSIETPPEQYYDTAGLKSIGVRMANGEAGIPVYLVWEAYPLSGESSSDYYLSGHTGGASIQKTDATGRATLTMNVPENAYVYWEIGGGTPDLVFTTRSGYSVQMTAPHVKGDFNGNGRVDIGDVARVAWMAIGLTPVDMGADFNGDGKVDGADATKIAYYYVGKISSL